MASSLDHIEQTLADAYSREIERGENIWRSLPFFAATLALELGATSQIARHLPPVGSDARIVSVLCIVAAVAAMLTATTFLAASIFPARFRYLLAEPILLDYSGRLDAYEPRRAMRGDTNVDARALLRQSLAHEYAASNDHNRRINQRRVLWRSIAGLATLTCVLSIIGLVFITTTYYVWSG
jgi:hypothetical protein